MTTADPKRVAEQEKGSGSIISDCLESMLPASVRSAGIEERGRARVLVAFTLVLCGAGIFVIAIQALRGTPTGVALGFVICFAYAAIVIALRAGAPLQMMSQTLITLVYVFSIGIVIASGANAASAVLVTSLIPMISILVAGPQSAVRWTIATLAGVGAAAYYASTTNDFLYAGKILTWEHARFPVMAVTIIMVHAATMALDHARSLAIREAMNAKDQLGRQEGRYRDIVENLGDVLMDFDDWGNCVFVSSNCIEVVGRPEESFLRLNYLALLHPDDLEPLRDLYRFSQAHPGATRVLPVRVLHQSGEWLHTQSSSRCYFTEAGNIHFLTIMRDTTDLRIAEMTIRHNDRLKAAGTLSAGIAHQINNPIGSILTASQFAQISLKEGDLHAVEQALKDNVEQATRCGKIVHSLLHFASRESPTTGRENLLEVVRRSREFTLSYAGENSIDIETSGHSEPLWAEISAIEIEQVIINLLRNAIESEPVSKRVELIMSVADSSARIEVRDDGRGISENDRLQIFDPFYTTRISDGGSGLGLSLSHRIIRDHGGRIEVMSVEGKGTSVSVELPLASPEPSQS